MGFNSGFKGLMPVKEEEVNAIFSVIHTGALRIPYIFVFNIYVPDFIRNNK